MASNRARTVQNPPLFVGLMTRSRMRGVVRGKASGRRKGPFIPQSMNNPGLMDGQTSDGVEGLELLQILRPRQVFQAAQAKQFEKPRRRPIGDRGLLRVRPLHDGDQSAANELP